MRESGIVIFISTVGIIIGVLSLMGAIIPIFGTLFIYISLPAVLISIVGLLVANFKNYRKTWPIVAVAISLVSIIISMVQFAAIKSIGEKAKQETDRMINDMSINQKASDELTPAKIYYPNKNKKDK